MTAPCAIEYILVTRWRGGKKGGQNRVCACDTRDRGVNKKLKPEHPSERTEESRPNGRGKKPGKPKQKGFLASFEEWFGSINMMNILYVWFPASWGPSVVEAIQTRK